MSETAVNHIGKAESQSYDSLTAKLRILSKVYVVAHNWLVDDTAVVSLWLNTEKSATLERSLLTVLTNTTADLV